MIGEQVRTTTYHNPRCLLFLHLLFFFLFKENGLLYLALTVLELTHSIDQAGVTLTEQTLPLPPQCWD